MLYNILIILSGVFALIMLPSTKGKFSIIVVNTLCVSIGMSLFNNSIIVSISYILFMLSVFSVIPYMLLNKGFTIKDKALILLIVIPVFIRYFFLMQHYPYVNLIALLMVIPVISYFVIIINKFKQLKNEIGFVTIIAIDALIAFITMLNNYYI